MTDPEVFPDPDGELPDPLAVAEPEPEPPQVDESTEEERVERVAAAVEAENASAPSEEDIVLLMKPPTVEPVGADAFRVSQYVLGEDGCPTLVEMEL